MGDENNTADSALEAPNNTNKYCTRQFWCCGNAYGGLKMAKGYAINGTARGAIVMSNLYLAASFVFLANQEAGCLDDENQTIPNCKERVYGMAPSAVVSNVAVVSGILSAFFMPLFGAILDYTSHRKLVGVTATTLMVMIQAVQIYTVESTWFPMVILQAVSGFLYQVLVLAIYAFLPEMARIVGDKVITGYHSTFTGLQFCSQLLFLLLIVGLQLTFEWSTVVTAQYSQVINTVWVTICFSASWRLMERVAPQRKLEEGQQLWSEGFKQVGRTVFKIYSQYGRTLGLYYPAVIFAEASTNAFTSISVIFLTDHIGMGSLGVGIFFMCALLAIIPGAFIGGMVTKRLNPKNSWRLALTLLVTSTVIGAFSLDRNSNTIAIYAWGFSTGMLLGWHYPVETLIYTLCLPRGQDAEFTGFYVYCTQILVWLPPLIFSGLVQKGISQTFGVFVVAMFGLISVIIISLFPTWERMRGVFELEEQQARDAERAEKDVMVEKDTAAEEESGDEPAAT